MQMPSSGGPASTASRSTGTEAAPLDLVHRGAEGAVPGQHERVRPPQLRGVAAEHRLGAPRGGTPSSRCPGSRSRSRRRAIVTAMPFVLGTPVTRGSRATAMDSARAVALNSVSAMWWALRPRMVSRWMFSRPWSASAQKKSSNSSVGMVPTWRALNVTSKCSQGRPERSITQRESASSSGT